MRYTTRGNAQKSRLIFDDKKKDVFVGDSFRCIIIQSHGARDVTSEFTGEAYAPF
jgi:hypothetical protein